MSEPDKPTVDNLPAAPPRRKGRPQKSKTQVGSQKRAGRPSLLTPEVQARICDGISNGLFINQAAKLAGVSIDAIEKWRTKGSEGIEPYKSFVDAFNIAELKCEEMLTKRWMEAAPQDWRACKEMLSKRFPHRWSDHAAQVAVFGAVEVQLGGLNIFIHGLDDEPPARPAIDVTPTPEQLRTLDHAKDEVLCRKRVNIRKC